MQGPVFLYYRLTDFYQNHRQYINSFDSAQLLGNPVSPSGNCGSLRTTDTGLGIYPCGLIANSMFNGKLDKVGIIWLLCLHLGYIRYPVQSYISECTISCNF